MKETVIKIRIVSCRNLAAKDRSGFSDPYCQIRLGKLKVNTRVITKSLNPSFMQEFKFPLMANQIEKNLQITVWDKDFLKSDFLGYVEFPIIEIMQLDFSTEVEMWHPLMARYPKEFISGDIRLQVGIVGDLEPNMKHISTTLNHFKEFRHASIITTDDEAELVFFNHTANVGDPEMAEGEAGISPGSTSIPPGSPIDDFETKKAENPPHSEVSTFLDHELAGVFLVDVMGARHLPAEKSTLKSFNCDPFVVVTYGTKTFRTKVKRHTLNPDWCESIYLHLKSKDLKSQWPLSFAVYDYERFSRNNEICRVDCNLSQLIDSCEKPWRHPNKPTIYPHSQMDIDLKPQNPNQIPANYPSPHLQLQCSFIPYGEIRRNFWLALLQRYESSDKVEDALSAPTVDKISLVTMLDSIECNFADETINDMFASVGRKPNEELTFTEAIEVLEAKIKPKMPTASSFSGIEPPKDADFQNERIIQIKACPICKKDFNKRGDFDMISHLALCGHGHLDKLDQLAMGGFLTAESASSKWVTKIFSYVSFGKLGIGRTNGNILYQDRLTGKLVKEKIPTYIRLGIRLLYQVAGSKSAVESKAIKKLLKAMTLKQGEKFDSPSSVKQISQFAAYHDLDLEEVLEPIANFKSFNEFFYRKLKAGARQLASPDKKVVVCPTDARTLAFNSVSQAKELWIKGTNFTLEGLLDNPDLASEFINGSVSIFRLAPQDYHRFHSPVDGVVKTIRHIEGSYYTVNPIGVRTSIDIYTENVRTILTIESEVHGKVAMVAIGAMLVGSVVITAPIGVPLSRMDEVGYFQFGGSTVVLIFQKDRVTFDSDILKNSSTSLETLCRLGNSLAKLEKQEGKEISRLSLS